MRRILAQTRKELTQIVRDWRTLVLALVLPLFLLSPERLGNLPDRQQPPNHCAGF